MFIRDIIEIYLPRKRTVVYHLNQMTNDTFALSVDGMKIEEITWDRERDKFTTSDGASFIYMRTAIMAVVTEYFKGSEPEAPPFTIRAEIGEGRRI